MSGPRNEFERHLVYLADGDPGALESLSDLLGFDLEEVPPPAACPRCARTLSEDQAEKRCASHGFLICEDCYEAEGRCIDWNRPLQPPSEWPLANPW